MDVTIVDLKILLVPLIGLCLASIAIGAWQWRTARKDWTLVFPALSFAFAIFACVVTLQAKHAPVELYVRYQAANPQRGLADFRYVNTHASVPLSRSYTIGANPRQRADLTDHSDATYFFGASTSYVRQFEPNHVLQTSLLALGFIVTLMFATTFLHLAPGPQFDALRNSLFVAQANAPIGTVLRGPGTGPRAVPQTEESSNVHEKATPPDNQDRQRRLDRLKRFEIESIMSERENDKPLTASEIKSIKSSLYRRLTET